MDFDKRDGPWSKDLPFILDPRFAFIPPGKNEDECPLPMESTPERGSRQALVHRVGSRRHEPYPPIMSPTPLMTIACKTTTHIHS